MPACLLLVSPAHAQDPTPSRPQVLADFGLGGRLVAHRWNPVLISIDTPKELISGTVVLSFVQDTTQSARVAAPFSAVPGITTTVQLAFVPDYFPERVEITLLNARGRPIASANYSSTATGLAAALPPTIAPSDALILTLGRASLPEIAKDWTATRDERRAADPNNRRYPGQPRSKASSTIPLHDAYFGRILPAQLPLAAEPLGCAFALVVDPASLAQDSVDPRAIDAVHAWVRNGGRLLILADQPGSAWSTWLPPEARAAIALGPPQRAPVTIDNNATKPPFTFANVPARPITLTDNATAWTLDWIAQGNAHLATGPVGLGLITIISLDPATLPLKDVPNAHSLAWQRALETLTADWANQRKAIDDARSKLYLQSDIAVLARNAALASAIRIPNLGNAVPISIGVAMIALALLVGPVDALLLRRRRPHLWWATALTWIALISLAAFVGPRLIRTAPNHLERLTLIDAIAAPSQPDQPRGYARSTSITTYYAASSNTARPTTINPDAWFHGIGYDNPYRWNEPTNQIATLDTILATTPTGGRALTIPALDVATWTVRATADSGPARPFRASLRHQGDDWLLDLPDLPPTASIKRAHLRLPHAGDTPQTPALVAPAAPPSIAFNTRSSNTIAWTASTTTAEALNQFASVMSLQMYSAEQTPSALMNLPGPDRRALAFDRYMDTGRFALATLLIEGLPADLALDWGESTKTRTLLRILIPVDTTTEHQP